MVRPATPEDAPTLARMLHAFNSEFGDRTPGAAVLEPRVRRFLADDVKSYLVAGEGPEGFAQASFNASVWSGNPVGLLEELYVVPDRRGEGIGTALMTALLDLARKRGAAGMEVITGEDDTVARHLYESFGFRNEIEGGANDRSLFYELDWE